jgi:hypothetical protein
MRNYKREYDNYHSRPEQKLRRAARNAARAAFRKAGKDQELEGKDVHHKDNNPLNNDKNNLSIVTQHYNRREPRLRKEGIDSEAMIALMQQYLNSKNKNEKKSILKQINKYQKKMGLRVTEDMGTVTGPHIAGTGDDNTVHTKRMKKKLKKRASMIKAMARRR